MEKQVSNKQLLDTLKEKLLAGEPTTSIEVEILLRMRPEAICLHEKKLQTG